MLEFRNFVLIALAGSLLALGACGGDSDSGTNSESTSENESNADDETDPDDDATDGDATEEWLDAFASSSNANSAGIVNEESGRCVGEVILDEIGLDRLEDEGYSAAAIDDGSAPEKFPFTQAEAEGIVDGMFDCEGFKDLITTSFLEGAGAPDLTDEQAACLADGLAANELIREGVAMSLISDEEPDTDALGAAVIEIFVDCDIPLTTLTG